MANIENNYTIQKNMEDKIKLLQDQINSLEFRVKQLEYQLSTKKNKKSSENS